LPWSRKSRPISVFSLWAVGPVQSLSACTRVYFTFLPVIMGNNFASDSLFWLFIIGDIIMLPDRLRV